MSLSYETEKPTKIPIFRGFQREQIAGFFEILDGRVMTYDDDEKIKTLEAHFASEAKRWYFNVNWGDWYKGAPVSVTNSRPENAPAVAAIYDERRQFILENFPFHSLAENSRYRGHLKQGSLESPRKFYDRVKNFVELTKPVKDEEFSPPLNELAESAFINGLYPSLRIYIPQLINTRKTVFDDHVTRVDKKFYRSIGGRDQTALKNRQQVNWTGVIESEKTEGEKSRLFPSMGAVIRLYQDENESPWDYFIRLGDACEHDGIDVDQSRYLLFYRGLDKQVQEQEHVWNAANLDEQVALSQEWWMDNYWKNKYRQSHTEFAQSRCEYRHVEEMDYDFSRPRYSILPVNGGDEKFFYDFMQPYVVTDPDFSLSLEDPCLIL